MAHCYILWLGSLLGLSLLCVETYLFFFLFEDIADIILFIFDNLQREFPKFFTFRARDKVGVLVQTYMSN